MRRAMPISTASRTEPPPTDHAGRAARAGALAAFRRAGGGGAQARRHPGNVQPMPIAHPGFRRGRAGRPGDGAQTSRQIIATNLRR